VTSTAAHLTFAWSISLLACGLAGMVAYLTAAPDWLTVTFISAAVCLMLGAIIIAAVVVTFTATQSVP
jgi:hypothetical protein